MTRFALSTASPAFGKAAAQSGRYCWSNMAPLRKLKVPGTLERHAGWQSATPYLHPWFRKKKFTVEDQIRRECRERGLPEPQIEPIEYIMINGRQRRPIHFHRLRSKRGLAQPDTKGSFWRLTFSKPITGPLALGFGCHYGLGLFQATDSL